VRTRTNEPGNFPLALYFFLGQATTERQFIKIIIIIIFFIIIAIVSQVFPGTFLLEPVVNPTTQASSF
jgi:hypothetical protein